MACLFFHRWELVEKFVVAGEKTYDNGTTRDVDLLISITKCSRCGQEEAFTTVASTNRFLCYRDPDYVRALPRVATLFKRQEVEEG